MRFGKNNGIRLKAQGWLSNLNRVVSSDAQVWRCYAPYTPLIHAQASRAVCRAWHMAILDSRKIIRKISGVTDRLERQPNY